MRTMSIILMFACSNHLSAQVAGDFDEDGQLTAHDINFLTVNIAKKSQSDTFDLDGNGRVNMQDIEYWVEILFQSCHGDSNLDGVFGTGDFVVVFEVSKYETGTPALYTEGDWNGDGKVNTADFVAVFQNCSCYEGANQPRRCWNAAQAEDAAHVVPEPANYTCFAIAMLCLAICHRNRLPLITS